MGLRPLVQIAKNVQFIHKFYVLYALCQQHIKAVASDESVV